MPFVDASFLAWIKEQREANAHFGVRIHLGEGIPIDEDWAVTQLRITFGAAQILRDETGCNVRIGHGLGGLWLPQLFLDRYLFSGLTRFPQVEMARSKAQRMLRDLGRYGWEMNITSNYYVASSIHTANNITRFNDYVFLHPVILATYLGLPVTLGSDDGGIFQVPTVRHEYESVARAPTSRPRKPGSGLATSFRDHNEEMVSLPHELVGLLRLPSGICFTRRSPKNPSFLTGGPTSTD